MPWKVSQHPSPKSAVGFEFEPRSHPVHPHFQGFLCAADSRSKHALNMLKSSWLAGFQAVLALSYGWLV